MQRPIGVTITAIFMALTAALDIIQSFVSLPSGGPSTHPSGPITSPMSLAIHAFLLAFVALEFVAVWGYWAGRSWARWLVLAGCFFFLTGLRDLRTQWIRSHFVGGLTASSAVLAVFLLWYLHTTDVRVWFARPVAEPATAE
jgi:hypothetical protein